MNTPRLVRIPTGNLPLDLCPAAPYTTAEELDVALRELHNGLIEPLHERTRHGTLSEPTPERATMMVGSVTVTHEYRQDAWHVVITMPIVPGLAGIATRRSFSRAMHSAASELLGQISEQRRTARRAIADRPEIHR